MIPEFPTFSLKACRSLSVLIALAALVPAARAQLYMDVNGATPGFGSISGATWDTAGTNWTTSAAGDIATIAWNNTSGSTTFSSSTTASITTGGNFTISGLTWDTAGATAARFLTLANSAVTNANQTITIADGGTIRVTNNGSYAAGIALGSRVSLVLGGSVSLDLGNKDSYITLSTFATTFTTGLLATTGNIAVNVGTLKVGANRTNSSTHIETGSLGVFQVEADGVVIGNLKGSGTVASQSNAVNRSLTVTQTVDATFSGSITPNTSTGVFNITKAGLAALTLSGSNSYDGTTTVSAGTLLVTGSHTGGGAYTVQSGGTFGGNGTVTTAGNAGFTLQTGGKLAPGTSAGTLKLDLGTGSLNISNGVSLTSSKALVFELGAVGGSDMIQLTNAASVLTIGSALLEFDDFDFSALAGFGAGIYTLFDTGSTISGTLGSNLSGTINGHDAVISFSGDGQDIILTVSVPEPGAISLTFAGLLSLVFLRRRASLRR